MPLRKNRFRDYANEFGLWLDPYLPFLIFIFVPKYFHLNNDPSLSPPPSLKDFNVYGFADAYCTAILSHPERPCI